MTRRTRRINLGQRSITVVSRKGGEKKIAEFRIIPRPGETVEATYGITKRNRKRKKLLTTYDARGNEISFVEFEDEPGMIYIFIVRSHLVLDRFVIQNLIQILQEFLDKRLETVDSAVQDSPPP